MSQITRPGVNARPLAGRAEAEKQSRQGEIAPFPAADEAPHEEVHQQDEENGVSVYRGDAGLHEVHEVESEDDRPAGGYGSGAEHPLQEGIEYRQHQRAEQRAGEAPAEGREAEELYAGGDYQLAQRRVGYLVGVDALDLLHRGAGMVNLVEIRAVEVAYLLRDGVLLVEERGAAGVILKEGGVYPLPVRAVERYLAQPELVGGYQPDIARGAGGIVLLRAVHPLENFSVALLERAGVRPGFSVLRELDGIAAGVKAAEIADLRDHRLLRKGDVHIAAPLGELA